MPVLLHRSSMPPDDQAYDAWVAVTDTPSFLEKDRRLVDLPRQLQNCFDDIRESWLSLARQIGANSIGGLSHTATGAAYINDFGLMLAWSRLVEKLAEEPLQTLVLCDDPWLFRHLATITGVTAGQPPFKWPTAARLVLRGVAARVRLVPRLIFTAMALRRTRQAAVNDGPVILVYGHPGSGTDGKDAYFGELMREIPALRRALHTDCLAKRSRELCTDGRSFSLHAWGNSVFAVSLLGLWWRLPKDMVSSREHWLLRRAVAHENSGGALAMTKWQIHCQNRWIADARPRSVAWPWENHPWERSFARTARRHGTTTIGYQHAVIGRHQFNFSPNSNPDDFGSLPDTIMCNGPAYRDQLAGLGHDKARLKIGGAFRVMPGGTSYHDPAGPVYVALSSIRPISRQMLEAVTAPPFDRMEFIVKDHPLYPMTIHETQNLKRTPLTIPASRGLRAVIYSTGTTGLEGMLAGVPTYRFLPDDRVAPDTLPDGVNVPECTARELAETLAHPQPPEKTEWAQIMAPVDLPAWRSVLAPEGGI